MMKKSAFCAAISLMTAVVSGGVSRAEPSSQEAASPAVLLPHADPRPIPDIDSYHVVTDTKQYEVRDKDGRLLGMRFSTPDGALCGLHTNIDLAPMDYEDWSYGTSFCFSDKFPQALAPDSLSVVGGTGKKLIENIYTDNVEDDYGYAIVAESIVAASKTNTSNSTDYYPEFRDTKSDRWDRDLNYLADVDAGHTPKDFPLLPAGSILSFTPDQMYATQTKTDTFKFKLPSLPVACAVGFNHVVWCASHTLVEVHYAEINTYPAVIPEDKVQPKGFYVTPSKAVYYNGYYDPGTLMATK